MENNQKIRKRNRNQRLKDKKEKTRNGKEVTAVWKSGSLIVVLIPWKAFS